MDQAAPATMDNKKTSARPALQNVKPYTQDYTKDGSKRGVVGRRQRDWDRNEVVYGSGGGSYRSGNGAVPAGTRTGWGRSANKAARNREKESGQVVCELDWSQDSVDDDDHFSSYADLQQSSRVGYKNLRNITHTVQSWWTGGGSGPNSRRNRGGGGAGVHGGARNKRSSYKGGVPANPRSNHERCLQARCQFVVNPVKEAQLQASASVPVGCAAGAPISASASFCSSVLDAIPDSSCLKRGGTSVNTALPLHQPKQQQDDPDELVPWSAVEEVLLHMTQPSQCPICLYPPVAPQMTRCGHIYCYPCILHYLALSDKKWRSCPICEEMVVRDDLKSAVCVVHPDYSVGSSIEMTLMKRDRHSMTPSPLQLPPHYSHNAFTRKTFANRIKVLGIIERERLALQQQMAAESSEPESCFIEQALSLLEDREQNLMDYQEMSDQDKNETVGRIGSSADEPADLDVTSLVEGMHNVGIETQSFQHTRKRKGSRGGKEVMSANSSVENYNSFVGCEAETNVVKQSQGSSNGESNTSKSRTPFNHNGRNCRALHFNSSDKQYLSSSSLQFEISEYEGQAKTDDYESDVVSVSSADVVFTEEVTAELSDTDIDISRNTTLSECLDSTCVSVADATDTSIKDSFRADSECLHFQLDDEITKNQSVLSCSTISTAGGANSKSNTPPKSVYYFYQASDGSHVYLHSLNAAMLTQQYGSEQNCPPTFTATIVEKKYDVISDDVRRRIKFLRHLPLSCPYEMVELDLHPPIVAQDILAKFKVSLSRREQHRMARAKEEQVIEKRVQAKEDKELYSRRFTTKVYSAMSNSPAAKQQQQQASSVSADNEWGADALHFPGISVPSEQANAAIRNSSISSDGASSPEFSASPPSTHADLQKPATSQLSFAKMVRTQQKQAPDAKPVWPSLGQPPAGGTEATTGTWPRRAAATASTPNTTGWGGSASPRPGAKATATRDESDEEDSFNAPDYKQAFSRGFDVMLQQSIDSAVPAGKKGKKGKKKSKQVLYLSGGGC